MSKELIQVAFHGATLIALKGDTPATTLVAMKPVVEGMGLDWEGQRQKIERHPVLKTCTFVTKVQMPGDTQARDVTLLPLNRLNFWLATIQPDRIKEPGVRARVIEYQIECADVLFEHFAARRDPDGPFGPRGSRLSALGMRFDPAGYEGGWLALSLKLDRPGVYFNQSPWHGNWGECLLHLPRVRQVARVDAIFGAAIVLPPDLLPS